MRKRKSRKVSNFPLTMMLKRVIKTAVLVSRILIGNAEYK